MFTGYSSSKISKKISAKRDTELEKASTSSKEEKHNEKYIKDKNKKSKPQTLEQCLEEILFKKNKFQISNAFDENNSEEFLNYKNQYLKEVVLSDKINKKSMEEDHLYDSFKPELSSNNNLKYKIIVSNYDEEKEKNQEKRKSPDNDNSKKNKKNYIYKK